MKNVLIIGSGGREHALADAFSRSNKVKEIFVSPGNDGIATEYKCLPYSSFEDVLDIVHSYRIDLVFIGPEQPIEQGLSDYLVQNGIQVIAPSRLAARLETSKTFAKEVLNRFSIPTAAYVAAKTMAEAEPIFKEWDYPLVIKADGLAAGKGVIIVENYDQASVACQQLLTEQAGSTGIIIEEFLRGWEVTLFAITDGKDYQTTLFAQDHKQLFDDDRGPNTGGMGAFCPVPAAESYRIQIEQDILEPVLAGMRELGCPYKGILYLGLMITRQGAKVIEFNCRFGDPEAQALLPLLQTDFVDVCDAVWEDNVANIRLDWEAGVSIAVVLAAPGYPGKYQTGIPLSLPALKSKAYFAGVKAQNDILLTSGGRVMAIQAQALDIDEARKIAYRDIQAIGFVGKVLRTDIGLRKNQISFGEDL